MPAAGLCFLAVHPPTHTRYIFYTHITQRYKGVHNVLSIGIQSAAHAPCPVLQEVRHLASLSLRSLPGSTHPCEVCRDVRCLWGVKCATRLLNCFVFGGLCLALDRIAPRCRLQGSSTPSRSDCKCACSLQLVRRISLTWLRFPILGPAVRLRGGGAEPQAESDGAPTGRAYSSRHRVRHGDYGFAALFGPTASF